MNVANFILGCVYVVKVLFCAVLVSTVVMVLSSI